MIDLSNYKVIHGNKVLNAIALDGCDFGENNLSERQGTEIKPIFIGVLAVNSDGNIVLIYDAAWKFQFIRVINGEMKGGAE